MFDLWDVWGTTDLAKVFGGGPDDCDDLTGGTCCPVSEEELAELCF